jgi:hypothetical protein
MIFNRRPYDFRLILHFSLYILHYIFPVTAILSPLAGSYIPDAVYALRAAARHAKMRMPVKGMKFA